jgi:hypothetical protein
MSDIWLKAEDLVRDGKWDSFELEISEVVDAGVLKYENGQVCEHRVLRFKHAKKQFALQSETNKTLMKYATGFGEDQSSEWVGKTIILTPTFNKNGNWFGQSKTTAVRIDLPQDSERPFIDKKHYGERLKGQPVGGVK